VEKGQQFKSYMQFNSFLYLLTMFYCLAAFSGYLPVLGGAILIFLIAAYTVVIYVKFKQTLGFNSVIIGGRTALWFTIFYCILLLFIVVLLLLNLR